jgi:multidrug efflux pump subunit AcrB
MKVAKLINDEVLIILLTTLTGVLGGIFALIEAHPQMDFYYQLPIFALIGVIVANLVLIAVYQLSKELKF